MPPYLARPTDVVRALVAVQAQDYGAGLWAIGQRTAAATRADVERALADRALVRTWPMRGTLHVVAAEDVRWLLALLAPRVIKRAASRHRQLGLDAKTFAKSRRLFEKHLAGGTTLTRPELFALLARANIDPREQRGIHILNALAMDRVVCYAAHRGKQPTFALLEDWVAPAPDRDGDEALGELARRYFLGHGPASIDDFTWWTGLTLREARRALDLARSHLESRTVDDVTYWSGPLETAKPGTAHLLSAWDEFTVGYRDRSAILDAAHIGKSLNALAWCVAVDGRVVGLWRRATKRTTVEITLEPFVTLDARAKRAIDRAIARYRAYCA